MYLHTSQPSYWYRLYYTFSSIRAGWRAGGSNLLNKVRPDLLCLLPRVTLHVTCEGALVLVCPEATGRGPQTQLNARLHPLFIFYMDLRRRRLRLCRRRLGLVRVRVRVRARVRVRVGVGVRVRVRVRVNP